MPDAKIGSYVDALNSKQQYAGESLLSRRHRVRNNLPGERYFCPLVRCTEKLKEYEALHLNVVANEAVKKTSPDILVRAVAFLLLKDSRASFQIEHEYPAQERAEKWGQVLGRAGRYSLSKEELLRLQSIVLENNRFIKKGFRKEEGFIGTYDRLTGFPIPDHISARWNDIDRLIGGMMEMYQRQLKNDVIDQVILAAIIAFGFVFIHPFVDGNGRIHRYLIQHILAETGFIPQGIVYPISEVILGRIDEYRKVLESYSRPRLDYIKWRSTDQGNVEILNETIDLYRFFDATKQAEFLYDCVKQAVNKGFPEEIECLEKYDRMKREIKNRFDMPDRKISLLIRFLEQNKGKLSNRAKRDNFKELSDDECQQLEELYFSI